MRPSWRSRPARVLAAAVVATATGAAALAACGAEGDASASPPATTTTPAAPSTTVSHDPPADDGARGDDEPRRVLVLGDSLAEGAADVGGLHDRFRDAGVEFVEVLASAGEDVSWAVEQVRSRALVPDVVVVVLGTNPSGDPTGFGAEVRSLLRELRRRGAEHIAWLTPAHRVEGRYDAKVAVLERVEGIDLLADWAAVARTDPGALLADGLHPSEEGYAELAEFLVATAIDVAH